jgi:hypothetical protein
MLHRAKCRSHRNRRTKNEPAIIMAIIALGALVAICGVMVIPPMRAAIVDLWQYRPPTR